MRKTDFTRFTVFFCLRETELTFLYPRKFAYKRKSPISTSSIHKMKFFLLLTLTSAMTLAIEDCIKRDEVCLEAKDGRKCAEDAFCVLERCESKAFLESVTALNLTFANESCPFGLDCDCFMAAVGVRFVGGEFKYRHVNNAESCAELCRSEEKCRFWSFQTTIRGRVVKERRVCFLKSELGEKRKDARSKTSYTTASKECEKFGNLDSLNKYNNGTNCSTESIDLNGVNATTVLSRNGNITTTTLSGSGNVTTTTLSGSGNVSTTSTSMNRASTTEAPMESGNEPSTKSSGNGTEKHSNMTTMETFSEPPRDLEYAEDPLEYEEDVGDFNASDEDAITSQSPKDESAALITISPKFNASHLTKGTTKMTPMDESAALNEVKPMDESAALFSIEESEALNSTLSSSTEGSEMPTTTTTANSIDVNSESINETTMRMSSAENDKTTSLTESGTMAPSSDITTTSSSESDTTTSSTRSETTMTTPCVFENVSKLFAKVLSIQHKVADLMGVAKKSAALTSSAVNDIQQVEEFPETNRISY